MEVYQLIDYVYAAIGLLGIISVPLALHQFAEYYTRRMDEVQQQAIKEYDELYNS